MLRRSFKYSHAPPQTSIILAAASTIIVRKFACTNPPAADFLDYTFAAGAVRRGQLKQPSIQPCLLQSRRLFFSTVFA
jgi:hypothetical protein